MMKAFEALRRSRPLQIVVAVALSLILFLVITSVRIVREAGRQALARSAMVEARAHLEHALALTAELADGPTRVLNVALVCGLGDVSNFNHAFSAERSNLRCADFNSSAKSDNLNRTQPRPTQYRESATMRPTVRGNRRRPRSQ